MSQTEYFPVSLAQQFCQRLEGIGSREVEERRAIDVAETIVEGYQALEGSHDLRRQVVVACADEIILIRRERFLSYILPELIEKEQVSHVHHSPTELSHAWLSCQIAPARIGGLKAGGHRMLNTRV